MEILSRCLQLATAVEVGGQLEEAIGRRPHDPAPVLVRVRQSTNDALFPISRAARLTRRDDLGAVEKSPLRLPDTSRTGS